MSQENIEYYSKFLTSSNRTNLVKNNLNYNSSSPTFNESITGANQQPEISNMTYNLFVKQGGGDLSKGYFKSKFQEQKEGKNIKKNNKINKRNIYAYKNNNSGRLKENSQKKKELLEEIIQANSKSIRLNNNNYGKNDELNEDEEEEKENLEDEIKRFNSDDLTSHNVVEINLENEIKNKRVELEKKHKEIINNNLPEIYNSINKLINDNDFYFIKNKYEEILKEYN